MIPITLHTLTPDSYTLNTSFDDVLTGAVTDAMELLFDDDSVYEPRPTEVVKVRLKASNRRDREEEGGTVKDVEVEVTIGPSLIPHAGIGVIANELIPANMCVEYLGRWVPVENDPACDVSGYRWTVFRWDDSTGEPLPDRKTAGFVDGVRESESNWPRFVNCSGSESSANLVQWQEWKHVFYGTKRDILPGEELLVWYGPGFARILGIPVDPPASPKTDSQ